MAEASNNAPAITETRTANAEISAQEVRVKALSHFHKNANLEGERTKPGEEFTTTRDRAAQLRANGLIEYVNDADGREIHGEIEDKRLTERVKQTMHERGLREKDKTTPLRNPKVDLADDPK